MQSQRIIVCSLLLLASLPATAFAQVECSSVSSCRQVAEAALNLPIPEEQRAALAFGMACDLRDAAACAEAAALFLSGGTGFEADPAVAVTYLQEGCNTYQGGDSCYAMAELYRTGRGVARDADLAARLMGFACEFGVTEPAGAAQCARADALLRAAAERALNTDSCPSGYSYIPSGVFEMGSPSTEAERRSDETQHMVTLTGGFCLQTTEVTQSQWRGVMGSNPSLFDECGGMCPVERVSWLDAVGYLNALSRSAGLRECYDSSGDVVDGSTPYECEGYRFPTEAEWEWAARAGTSGARYESLSRVAWYSANSDGTTHPVGRLEANAWGLYDMLGNVEEWTHDSYGSYQEEALDPWGLATGPGRVNRGGSWLSDAQYVRAANRFSHASDFRNDYLGFRPARSAR